MAIELDDRERAAQKVKAALDAAGEPSDQTRVDKFIEALDNSVKIHREHTKDA